MVNGIAGELLNGFEREYNHFRKVASDAIIFLTYRCTSRCKTCNIWKIPKGRCDELDWQQWKEILLRLHEYSIKTVELFGGDALLRKELLYNMIRFCSSRGIKTFFPTNSLLLDRDAARNLVDSGLDTIYFSLDDVGTNNDNIRGAAGSFRKVSNSLEEILKARGSRAFPNIIVCSTISNLNYTRLAEIAQFLKTRGVQALYPRTLSEFNAVDVNNSEVCGIKPEPFFVSTETESHQLTRKQLDEFLCLLSELKHKNGSVPYINGREVVQAQNTGVPEKCLMCSTVMVLNPNGDVVPCLFFNRYILGNLALQKPMQIWGNTLHRKFSDAQRTGKIAICRTCISYKYYPSLTDTCSYYAKETMRRFQWIK